MGNQSKLSIYDHGCKLYCIFETSVGTATWTCTSGTLDAKYRPNACS
ncbi:MULTISPECIES: pilin [Acinetobacter]|uniref:Pilin n=1 Tax=Acinetobacter septicus TaxID=465797 RepID=A0ABD7F639_9GAMM|nr:MULTISPECIES: pilin [Acinetobacter]QXZ23599.1 pilin [Acinetobacter septicus]